MEDFNPFTLKGKTILVTGASSGIGRGIAIACSKMGASVIINGRNKQRLDETLSQMSGTENVVQVADLCDSEHLTILVKNLPQLDGIVHCAGIGQRILCRQLQESDIDNVMDVNFKAPVMLQAEVLKQKKLNQRASVVFISSLGCSGLPYIGNSVYSASKGALISYANCLALELAPRLIRVNCIQPAMIWTDFLINVGIDADQSKEDEKKYPLKRYGKPEDVANLAIYLLSDASEWMSGSSIKLSGGM